MTSRTSLVAAFFALGAFTFFVGSDTMNKLASDGLGLNQRCFLNQFVSGLVFLAASFRGRGLAELKTRKPFFHLARGLVNCVNALTLIYAVANLPLANFYAIAFTSPFMIALISWLFLGEKISAGLWVAILVGFLGVLVSINPASYDPQAWGLKPVIAMLVANLCYAFYAITVKQGGQDETPTSLTFYPELASSLLALGLMLYGKEWIGDWRSIGFGVASGLFNGVAVLCVVQAFRRGSNAFVAPFQYSQIVIGALLGFVLWNDVPTWHLVAGSALIIGAGLYILWRGSPEKEPPQAAI